jgi:hypothetical protein
MIRQGLFRSNTAAGAVFLPVLRKCRGGIGAYLLVCRQTVA